MGVPALLLLYCGLRCGELIALTWNDVSIKDKNISVNKAAVYVNNEAEVKKPKSNSGIRTIPIPNSILDAVKTSRRKSGSSLVCPATNGSIMTRTAFQKAWKNYIHYLNIQAGGRAASRSRPKLTVISNITPHMFRHTYATILYNAGVDVKSAQRFMGHADINVTLKIYTHLSAQKEQEAIAALNKHLSEINHPRNNEKTLMQ